MKQLTGSLSIGANELKEKKKESLFISFLKQFNDFMIIILIIASIISAIVSNIQGENDYVDSIIIIAIVVLNAIMGVIQEAKAEKSIEALKQMTAPMAKVKRNGKIEEISAKDVVPGDIVILESGNFVPADCRLISAFNLKIEESSLTGETEPVLKNAEGVFKGDIPVGDRLNMAYSSTTIVNGHAEAIVVETGMNTMIGKIAHMISNDETPQTPIQKKLAEVGRTLGIGCLIICAIVFVIGLSKKIEPVQMFMTSVGLAVAAIPEGLPAIITIMLSIGVTAMSKKNAIIRKLPAVETLGSSSVICSDKTGTLTQNKMKVVEIQDINGIASQSSKEFILALGAMCTDCNINNNMAYGEPTEVAIVNCGIENGQHKEKLYQEMEKVSEIPFDSERKMMTTIHKIGSKYRVITKGAPDVLLSRCTKFYSNGKIMPISELMSRNIENSNRNMADKALRVIAVSYADLDYMPTNISSEVIEQNLVFVRINRHDRPST